MLGGTETIWSPDLPKGPVPFQTSYFFSTIRTLRFGTFPLADSDPGVALPPTQAAAPARATIGNAWSSPDGVSHAASRQQGLCRHGRGRQPRPGERAAVPEGGRESNARRS